ncbi:prepilin peptidase [Croceicoccus sp. F390]|uniref:Prepilin peptidase n=1 Tax=Croceicoccus esteveae TaxID=3075597 RepID=A0ABU2ZGH6_9SPHN|nr:prepilin peptidase [Croceicoccus sp. F390]MDT0575690.1 prepilin peptidase [Croceicoccus sp. F390]
MINGNITYGLVAALAIGTLYAAVTDLRHRRISNVLCLGIAALAPLFWWTGGLQLWPDIAGQMAMAAATFLGGALLFRCGQVGGGDVKLLTAIALCLEPRWFVALLVIASVINGVLTLALFWRRRRQRRAGATIGKLQVPYAVPVAAAILLILMMQIPSTLVQSASVSGLS